MYSKSFAAKEIDNKLMLVWKESNFCHSDDYWYTPITELSENERNLDDGRFVNYLHNFPDGSDWLRSNVGDRATYCDGVGLIETIEWIAEHIKEKWSMQAGTYGGVNLYWFEDGNDRFRFADWVAKKSDIEDAIIPPISVVHLDI